jgi:hypothetical protein
LALATPEWIAVEIFFGAAPLTPEESGVPDRSARQLADMTLNLNENE